MVTTTFASPLGEILLAADGRGLTGLWFEGQEHFGSTLLKEDPEHVEGADAVSGAGGMSSVRRGSRMSVFPRRGKKRQTTSPCSIASIIRS